MLHPQATQMREILEREGINCLYHFTSVDNLPLIAERKCIYSKEKLEELGLLTQVITGGNPLSLSLDRSRGNWHMVSLYFSKGTPMAYLKQADTHLCYLLIDSEVALWHGVEFTDINATDNQVQREQGLTGLNLIDFSAVKAVFPFGSQRRSKKKQAEVLVPNEIPLNYIKGIVFISEASLREGERIWCEDTRPPYKVDKNSFSVGWPYVDTAILTATEVTKDDVQTRAYKHSHFFSTLVHPHITLLISAYVTAGLRIRVRWVTSSGEVISENDREFEKEGYLWHWNTMNTTTLHHESYRVEYYLGDVRWLSMPLVVATS